METTTKPVELSVNDPALFVGPKLATCKREGWTTAEFYDVFDDEDPKLEILGGELFVAPSPFQHHSIVQFNLVEILRPLVRKLSLGRLLGEIDVVFDDGTVLRPDLTLIPTPSQVQEGLDDHIHDTPLLVIEVLSKGTRRHDQMTKALAYERFGVPNYWIADPRNEIVTAFALKDGIYVDVEMPKGILKAPPLADIEIPFTDIFRI